MAWCCIFPSRQLRSNGPKSHLSQEQECNLSQRCSEVDKEPLLLAIKPFLALLHLLTYRVVAIDSFSSELLVYFIEKLVHDLCKISLHLEKDKVSEDLTTCIIVWVKLFLPFLGGFIGFFEIITLTKAIIESQFCLIISNFDCSLLFSPIVLTDIWESLLSIIAFRFFIHSVELFRNR